MLKTVDYLIKELCSDNNLHVNLQYDDEGFARFKFLILSLELDIGVGNSAMLSIMNF